MDRTLLPLRKNCEGYFRFGDKVVCIDSGKGYIEFPGGGVDPGEEPIDAIKREAKEEAGVIVEGLKEVKVMRFIWGEDWARTEKQKERYKKFQGEEMHFFTGHVKEVIEPTGDNHEKGWGGERMMKIKDAIKILEKSKPFSDSLKEYREFQLKSLKKMI